MRNTKLKKKKNSKLKTTNKYVMKFHDLSKYTISE